MANIEPMLISRKETMTMLGVRSNKTFRKLLADGVIPNGIKVGSRLRWNREALIKSLGARQE